MVDTGGSSVLSNLEVAYYYDDDNRLTDKVTTLDGTQMESSTCQYDENSNLTHMAKTIQRGLPPTPAGLLGQSFDFSYSYSYDSLDRQIGVTNSNGDTFTAEYDDVGNMLSINYPDSTSSLRSFDAENRITSVKNDHPNPLNDPPYISYTYRYDNNGNCTSLKKDPNYPYVPGFMKYEYDKLNRLTYDESEQIRFVYDDAGNKIRDRLLSSNRNIVYTYNNAHQVVKRTPGTGLQMPTYNFEYDVNGNQSRKYSPDSPSIPNIVSAFDAINRLRSVKSYQNPGSRGAAVAKAQGPDEMLYTEESFSYDGDEELFFSEKKTYTSPPATSDYNFNNVYHGYEFGALLYKNFTSGAYTGGALDETTLVHSIEYYTYLNGLKVGVSALAGEGRGSRVIIWIPPSCKSTFFLYDGMGNIVQTSNRAGDIPYAMYKYSAYGACALYDGQDGYRSSYKGYDQGPFGCKTGVRQYDPDTGRFLSPDAFKGYLANPSSQNPYMYCGGNPIKYADPSGYFKFENPGGGKYNKLDQELHSITETVKNDKIIRENLMQWGQYQNESDLYHDLEYGQGPTVSVKGKLNSLGSTPPGGIIYLDQDFFGDASLGSKDSSLKMLLTEILLLHELCHYHAPGNWALAKYAHEPGYAFQYEAYGLVQTLDKYSVYPEMSSRAKNELQRVFNQLRAQQRR